MSARQFDIGEIDQLRSSVIENRVHHKHAEVVGLAGRVYQKTIIDTYSKVDFAKLYHTKIAITAAEMLNDRVLRFFQELGIRVSRVLTDRGAEYCGLPQ